MICISLLLVAVGVVTASPHGFLQDTPEVQIAKANFIAEYNRLARLAAEAPDIHIYSQRPVHYVDNAIPIDPPRTQRTLRPVARQSHHNVLNDYSFSANIGDRSQFIPSQFSGYQPVAAPVHSYQTAAVQPRVVTQQPWTVWTGPFADTVPAGVYGLPVPVTDTPEVQAAKDAHFRAVAAAYRNVRPSSRNNYY